MELVQLQTIPQRAALLFPFCDDRYKLQSVTQKSGPHQISQSLDLGLSIKNYET